MLASCRQRSKHTYRSGPSQMAEGTKNTFRSPAIGPKHELDRLNTSRRSVLLGRSLLESGGRSGSIKSLSSSVKSISTRFLVEADRKLPRSSGFCGAIHYSVKLFESVWAWTTALPSPTDQIRAETNFDFGAPCMFCFYLPQLLAISRHSCCRSSVAVAGT